jgi:hypothetical protein
MPALGQVRFTGRAAQTCQSRAVICIEVGRGGIQAGDDNLIDGHLFWQLLVELISEFPLGIRHQTFGDGMIHAVIALTI